MFDVNRYPKVGANKKIRPYLVVSEAGGKSSREKEYGSLTGLGASFLFKVHNQSLANLMRGIYERLLFVPAEDGFVPTPLPKKGEFPLRMSWFANAVIKNSSRSNPILPIEFAELYQARKRTVYMNAVSSLDNFGISKFDSYMQTFTKVEKVNFTTKSDPAPRIIQPRSPRYNVSVGVFIKPMEKMLCNAVSKVLGSHTIVKGLNADEVGRLAKEKWDKFSEPVGVCVDAKRFDSGVSVDALRWEHGIYLGCVARSKDRKVLAELLSWQLTNTCRTFVDGHKICYGVSGSRASGDMNTGLGNCLIATGILASYCKDHGISKVEFLNNGDDCVIICEKSDLPLLGNFADYSLRLGFRMVVEDPVYELEHIEFCQSRFVQVNGCYRQIRNPPVAVCKDSVIIKSLHCDNDFRAWIAAVGEGGLALNSGVPVMQSYYECFCRNSNGVKALDSNDPVLATGTRMLTKGMISKHSPVDAQSRYSFWLATGITPDQQEVLESHYHNLTLNPTPSPDEFPILSLL